MAVLIESTLATEVDTLGTRAKVRPSDIKSGTYYGELQLRGSILVIKDNLNTASGYLAFGTSMTAIPTSPTTGTGIYIDYRGIYGNASGTSQFYLQSSDGKAYAAGGKVVLDAVGINLPNDGTTGLVFTNGVGYDAAMGGDNNVGYQQFSINNNVSEGKPDSGILLVTRDDSSNLQYFVTFAEDGVGGYAGVYGDAFLGLAVGRSILPSGTPTAPLSLLHLASTAPTFRMEDTTSSAKSLLLTVDANTATFAEAAGTSVLTLGLAAGSVILGSAAVATNASDGFLWIASCAGTPTGTPTSHTGRVPLVFDTTNDKLYVYDGGWIDVT